MTSQPLSERTKDQILRRTDLATEIIVVSDLHIQKQASPRGGAFLRLLKKAKEENVSYFIVLGDLFDLWLGKGSYFINEHSKIIEQMKELSKTCKLIYFEGNHDLHLRKFWQDELGFQVFTGPQILECGGVKIWAEHGDEINREDRDYLFLRWLLRTKPLEFLTYNLPSVLSHWIGERASQASRAYTEKLNNNTVDMFRRHAENLSQKVEFDFFLVGHTHVFDDFSFDSGRRRLVNLGSWFEKPRYLKINAATKTAEILEVLF